ncbi:MAG: class I SAM-dependent methyltransferase [Anaerolineae bacterium]|nr:class I SAM-dependent methyltransferase [Anaerolineae bacterium]
MLEIADKAALRGNPSFVWRAGQDRRLGMIAEWANLVGARVLVDGCGLGMYVRKLRDFTPYVYGMDIEFERVAEGATSLPGLAVAAAEGLPYPDNTFDTVLSHEVLEHVTDDRQAVAEILRVLRPYGRLVVFVPNRLFPFETHGVYWRGQYHFGNIPLVNYLPDVARDRLAPHVRAYTGADLRRLLDGLPARVVTLTQIYPGYDNITARSPHLGRVIRGLTYSLERTPLAAFGLSHFAVIEKTDASAEA